MSPYVTAICPTQGSRAWCLPLALEALGAQREVQIDVIVGIARDDETPWTGFCGGARRPYVPLRGRMCGSQWIEYDGALSLGEKRRRLCAEAARHRAPFLADWVTFWDDDDWKHPDYLAKAVSVASDASAAVVGVGQALFVDVLERRAWVYCAPPDMLVGTSMVIHRDVLAVIEIPARERGEDAMFLRACRDQGMRICRIDDYSLVVAFQHGQSTGRPTWPPPAVLAEYVEVDLDHVRARMDELDRWLAAYQASESSNQR